MKRAMITGIADQDGSYLTELLLTKDYEVHGIIRRASVFNRESPRRGETFVPWKITRAVAHIKAGLQDKLDGGATRPCQRLLPLIRRILQHASQHTAIPHCLAHVRDFACLSETPTDLANAQALVSHPGKHLPDHPGSPSNRAGGVSVRAEV